MRAELRLTLGKWVFAVGIVGAALAIGALDRRVLCVVAAVITIGAMFVLTATPYFRPRRCASMLVYVALGLLAFTAFQAIPLPAHVVSILSPHAADIWARCLRPLGEAGPAWHPLTVDPPATHLEILRGTTYLVALVGALAIARERDGVRFLVRVLIAGGVLVAIGSVVHAALGLDKVYGFVKPKTVVASIAPLLNSNHAGGYVNIALVLVASATLAKTPSIPRFPAVIVLLGLVGFEVWNASRGAVATMLVGLVALFALQRLRRGHVSLATNALVPLLIAAGGIGMIVLSAFENSVHGLTDTSLSKLRIGAHAVHAMVPAYTFFGAGRGAFESAFPEYMNWPQEGFIVFTHPENIVAQWVCEWGLFVALVAGVAIVIALRPRNALVRGEVAIGSWVALAVVVLQNLVDFSMEVPGVMVALVLCAAIVTSGAAHRDLKEADARTTVWRPWALVVLVAVCGTCILAERGQPLVDAKPRFERVASNVNLSRAEFISAERSVTLDHPAEPYFAFAGGVRTLRDKGDILPWIERTLERAPIYPRAHLLLAQWLRRKSKSQARLEYRIAADERMAPAPRELVGLIDSFDDALEAVPSGALGVETLDALSGLLDESHPSTRARIDAEVERRDATRISPAMRGARDALADARSPELSPWCAADACFRDALAQTTEIEHRAPSSSAGYVYSTTLQMMHGDPEAALTRLRGACTTVTDRAPCLREIARLDVSAHSSATNSDIEAVAREGCPASHECVDNLLLATELEHQRHNTRRALVFLRRAADSEPSRADLQERVAAQAAADGLHEEAASIYDKLLHTNPTDSRYADLAKRERELERASPDLAP